MFYKIKDSCKSVLIIQPWYIFNIFSSFQPTWTESLMNFSKFSAHQNWKLRLLFVITCCLEFVYLSDRKILSTFSPQITWPTANSIIRDFDFKFIRMKVHARLVKLKRARKHFQAVNSSLSISWFSWIGQGHKASNGRWGCYVGMYRGFKKNIFKKKICLENL